MILKSENINLVEISVLGVTIISLNHQQKMEKYHKGAE